MLVVVGVVVTGISADKGDLFLAYLGLSASDWPLMLEPRSSMGCRKQSISQNPWLSREPPSIHGYLSFVAPRLHHISFYGPDIHCACYLLVYVSFNSIFTYFVWIYIAPLLIRICISLDVDSVDYAHRVSEQSLSVGQGPMRYLLHFGKFGM